MGKANDDTSKCSLNIVLLFGTCPLVSALTGKVCSHMMIISFSKQGAHLLKTDSNGPNGQFQVCYCFEAVNAIPDGTMHHLFFVLTVLFIWG